MIFSMRCRSTSNLTRDRSSSTCSRGAEDGGDVGTGPWYKSGGPSEKTEVDDVVAYRSPWALRDELALRRPLLDAVGVEVDTPFANRNPWIPAKTSTFIPLLRHPLVLHAGLDSGAPLARAAIPDAEELDWRTWQR